MFKFLILALVASQQNPRNHEFLNQQLAQQQQFLNNPNVRKGVQVKKPAVDHPAARNPIGHAKEVMPSPQFLERRPQQVLKPLQKPKIVVPVVQAPIRKEPKRMAKPALNLQPVPGSHGRCLSTDTDTAQISFCLSDRCTGGNCAGGVFRGKLKCTASNGECQRRYDLHSGESRDVIVKFNQVGSEKGRKGLPASSTQDEVETMTSVQSHPNAIRLFDTLGNFGQQVVIDKKKFWLPGMVMEFVDNMHLHAYIKYMAKRPKLDLTPLATIFKCVYDQLLAFTEFTISRGFVHQDMHVENILLTNLSHTDRDGNHCVLVKVIDYGVVHRFSHKTLKSLALFADVVDLNTSVLLKYFPQLAKFLAPSERVQKFFTNFLKEAGVDKKAMQSMNKVCNTLRGTRAYFCDMLIRQAITFSAK